MRRVVLMAVLALALPVAAFANSIDITNVGGTLSANANGGLTLTGSTIKIYGATVGTNLGTLTFSIDSAPTSGNLQSGATFGAGGTFTISINGGPTYTGTFTNNVTWTLLSTGSGANATHYYTLQGAIGGPGFSGATIQITVNTGKGFFSGSSEISSGDTNIVVPEPGTLGMLGTGLVGIAGLIRRKIKLG